MSRACLCGVAGCTRHGKRRSTNTGAYGADHQERRRRLIAQANANPATARCRRCLLGPIAGDPWEAGHLQDRALGGGPDVVLEHRSCNRRAGAQLGAQLRKQAAERAAERRIAETYRYLETARG
jgi:hypothetical protein